MIAISLVDPQPMHERSLMLQEKFNAGGVRRRRDALRQIANLIELRPASRLELNTNGLFLV